jgi:DNA-binding transcriptional LysR family regulator
MEMHQVRYFLATAAELNFTKAAEKCNVSQPSLTRAIKHLEEEFGGDLFRRERPQAQLTELGERMHPLMKQIYDSALGARSLASSIKSGELGSLKLALSHTVELGLLIPYINELRRLFTRLELKLLRGSAAEVLELLKRGEAELAIASELVEQWERLDRWPLFNESFHLVVGRQDKLASQSFVHIGDLRGATILLCSRCEHAQQTAALLHANNLEADHRYEIDLESDLMFLVEAGHGNAIVPGSAAISATLVGLPVKGVDLRRTVYVYAVAGRQRSAVGSAILTMMRAADWSQYEA